MATVNDILARVRDLTGDISEVRWSNGELYRWVYDGQVAVATLKPDATAVVAEWIPGTGASPMYDLPAASMLLLDMLYNVDSGAVIRIGSRDLMDSMYGAWYMATPSADVKHYVYDTRYPNKVVLYPRPTASTKVMLVYSALPTEPTTTTEKLSVPDRYMGALANYVLYRAYSKASRGGGSIDRAAGYYNAFKDELGVMQQATAAMTPAANSVQNAQFGANQVSGSTGGMA